MRRLLLVAILVVGWLAAASPVQADERAIPSTHIAVYYPQNVSDYVAYNHVNLADWYEASFAVKPARSQGSSLEAKVAAEVTANSEVYALDPLLVWAIIEAESSGNPCAVSPAGALGLMQVMPSHFKQGEDPFDVSTNVSRGTQILASYIGQFSSLRLGLAAYNAGPNAVKRYGGVPPYEETQRFVRNVLARHKQLLARSTGDPS